LTYGGKIDDRKEIAPGEYRGHKQSGAKTQVVRPGDFVLIQPGMPHHFDAARARNSSTLFTSTGSEFCPRHWRTPSPPDHEFVHFPDPGAFDRQPEVIPLRDMPLAAEVSPWVWTKSALRSLPRTW